MVLHTQGEQLKHVNLSDAFRQGYVFQVTDERLVFRTAYGQEDSVSTEVNDKNRCLKREACKVCFCFSFFPKQMSGVPVEVVRATLYSRQGWVMFMIDLVATCSMRQY